MLNKILKFITIVFIAIFSLILGFKVLGTSYCYIKTPETKEEANQLISFCGRSDLLFDIFFSKARTNIYENYPNEFQNEASATYIISYYSKNELLKHLDRIEILTEIITDDVWKKEKKFYFILDDDFFENNLPLEFCKKVFNKIYTKYYPIILNDKELTNKDKDLEIKHLNKIKEKLNIK